MAQLPPKVPFHYHNAENLAVAASPPPWHVAGEEFSGFSAEWRGPSSHRRSASDSVAFLEAASNYHFLVNNDSESYHYEIGGCNNRNNNGFDDEELQFMSMFVDDPQPSSPPSEDPNNNSGAMNVDGAQLLLQPKSEQRAAAADDDEAQSESCSNGGDGAHGLVGDSKVVDPKRIKRILANRQSAQRSRVRKLHYVSELERSVTSLQAEVSVLSPRVAYLDHQRLVLKVDNGVLKQRMAALAQDKIFKDAHQEALRKEIERLRQIYYNQQNLKAMENNTAGSVPSSMAVAEKGQMATVN